MPQSGRIRIDSIGELGYQVVRLSNFEGPADLEIYDVLAMWMLLMLLLTMQIPFALPFECSRWRECA